MTPSRQPGTQSASGSHAAGHVELQGRRRRRGRQRGRPAVVLQGSLKEISIWLWLSKPMGSHFGGFGAPPILEPILVGIGMFIGGTGV